MLEERDILDEPEDLIESIDPDAEHISRTDQYLKWARYILIAMFMVLAGVNLFGWVDHEPWYVLALRSAGFAATGWWILDTSNWGRIAIFQTFMYAVNWAKDGGFDWTVWAWAVTMVADFAGWRWKRHLDAKYMRRAIEIQMRIDRLRRELH